MHSRRGCCLHCGIFVTDTLLGISDANIETTQKTEKDNKGNKDKNNKGGKNDTTLPPTISRLQLK